MRKHNAIPINCRHMLTSIGYLDDGAVVNVCTNCGKRCLLNEKELKEWEEYEKEAEEYQSSKHNPN